MNILIMRAYVKLREGTEAADPKVPR